ncbi:MAG TPA: M28 family peptidase [Candidatus Acidoferrales bacterium]|nr:M28 family peptidase [Candidatus Acidoferrales bacterium]
MNLTEQTPRGGTFVVVLSLYAAVICLAAFRAQPPPPKPADGPTNAFSATRAKDILKQLLGNGAPHPVGSAADSTVRDGIVAQLTQLGYQSRVQDSFVCGEFGQCAEVKNVEARLDGSEPGAVLVSAHYDSVPAGPGASDDGAGTVSVLEIARALKASPPLRHPVVFLLDEGEEAGLFGAVAFVQDDPWAKEVRADVNMDNRGTSGPTAMFETGNANQWVIRLFAKSVHHADGTSLSYTVYKSLPNDTDFTIFKHAGYQGLNFAFINDVAHYHTPLDNYDNASAASIQEEGESGLEAVRALANSDLNFGPPSDAVYAGLFGWKTIWWPARETAGLAILALVLLLIEAAVLVRRGKMRMKAYAIGLFGWPSILAVSAVIGVVLQWFLRKAGAIPSNWVAHSAPLLVAFWALGFAAAAIVGVLFARLAGFWGLWSGIWIWWAIVALVLGISAPGLSYFFVVPSVTAAIFGLAILFAGRDNGGLIAVGTIIPAVVAAIAGFGMLWFLYVALGNVFLAGIAVSVALIAAPLAPFAGAISAGNRWKFPLLTVLAVAIGAIAALFAPHFSATSPEGLNLQYHLDADANQAEWLAYPSSGRLPPAFRKAASFARTKTATYPWDASTPYAASAPLLNLPAPELTVRSVTPSQGKYEYDVFLKSPRGAPRIILGFPPNADVESVFAFGHSIPPLDSRMLRYTHGWHLYGDVDVPADGLEMKFTSPSAAPVEALLIDESYGLPPQGAFLANARPDTAVANNSGDAVTVTRHVTLKP